MSHKLLILGSSGFLGRYFMTFKDSCGIARSNSKLSYASEYTLDRLENTAEIRRVLHKEKPTAIINCIAMTSIERCEANPLDALRVNALFPGTVAELAQRNSIPFVQFSTDAIFDGRNAPHCEFDLPSPQSVYGFTKLIGEKHVQEVHPNALVIRTNFFGYSFKRPSLFNFFYNNLLIKKDCFGYEDVVFSPGYVKDICFATLELMSNSSNAGIFHLAGNEVMSKFQFGIKIASAMGVDLTLIKPIKMPDHSTNERRSRDLRLSSVRVTLNYESRYTIEEGIVDSLQTAKRSAL